MVISRRALSGPKPSAYDDYIAGKGEAGAKEAGKFRVEGKTYEVKDGDVLHFLFNG